MNFELKNSFSLIGNISKINEIKEQSNGTKYRYFSVAQNNKYTTKDGKEVKETSFFDFKVYESDFDKFENILKIGKYVHVQGYIKSFLDMNRETKEIKVAKSISDLSNSNSIPSDVKEIMDDLADYNWLEDSSNDISM